MAYVFTRVVRVLRLPQAIRATAIFIFCVSGAYPSMSSASGADSIQVAASPPAIVHGLPTLSLETAIRLATEHNAEIRAATNEVAATEAGLVQLGARPNPEVAYSVEDLKKATRTTTLQINQVLELGGKRSARIAAGERTRDAATADRTIKIVDVRASVVTAFFDVLVSQERLALADAALMLAQRGTEIAGKRVAAGKVSPVEETKARVAQANVKLELVQAKADLVVARGRLCATWSADAQCFGIAEGRPADVPDALPFENLATLVGSSPSVQRATVEVARRSALAQVEKTRQTMNVTLSVGVKRAEDIGRNQALVGLSVPLPLFDHNQGSLLEAMRRTDKARDELDATESRVRVDLLQARQQWTAARDAIDVLREDILPGAQSAYDAAAKGFEFGKFTFLDVLDAQRTLLQAKTQYLTTLATLHRAHAEIDRLIGTSTANNISNGKTFP